jgi:hypothetical protein
LGWVDEYVSWTTSGPRWKLVAGGGLVVFLLFAMVGLSLGPAQQGSAPEAPAYEQTFAGSLVDELETLVEDGEELAEGLADDFEEGLEVQPVDASDSAGQPEGSGNPFLFSFILLLVIVAVFHLAATFLLTEPEVERRDQL